MSRARVERHLPVTARDAVHATEVAGPRYERGRRFFAREVGALVRVEVVTIDPVDRHVIVEMVEV